MEQSLPDRVIMAMQRGCCVPSTLWHHSWLHGEAPVQNALKLPSLCASPELWVNTAFLPTAMKPGVFQNKYCFLVTNINKCIAHYIFGEECARPTFLKSNGEVLPLFPSSLHTGKFPLSHWELHDWKLKRHPKVLKGFVVHFNVCFFFFFWK